MAKFSRLETKKSDCRQIRWVDVDQQSLAEGQARLSIDVAALTANNITYGVMGDTFGYWTFFPVESEGWGCLPVWGYATVTEENASGLSVGERIYGYFPFANELVVSASGVTPRKFVDGAEHRAGLPIVYNEYLRTSADPSHASEKEAHRALFVPLAATSFGLADFLTSQDYLGADAVISVSASSKTAIGMALILKEQASNRPVIGLTSPKNVAAVEALGLYDRVLAYDQVNELDASVKHVMVDFAGNAAVSAKIHAHLGDNMLHNALVGASHPDEPRKADGMNDERSKVFFMPGYAEARAKATNGQFLKQMFGAGSLVADEASAWMKLERATGRDGITALYGRVYEGELSPDQGGIIELSSCGSA